MSKKTSEARRAQIEREVITCLYRLLNASDPQIPVEKNFVGQCEEVLDDLLEERALSAFIGQWGLAEDCLAWIVERSDLGEDKQSTAAYHRCLRQGRAEWVI